MDLDQKKALDIDAAAAQGSLVACSASGVEIECPLTVPVDGVHCWESGDCINVPPHTLPPSYTIAVWLRLDRTSVSFDTLLQGGNNAAVVIGPEGTLGVSMADAPGGPTSWSDGYSLPKRQWACLAIVARSNEARNHPHLGRSSLLVGSAADAGLRPVGELELVASGATVRTLRLQCGSLSRVSLWHRALALDELDAFFAEHRDAHGCALALVAPLVAIRRRPRGVVRGMRSSGAESALREMALQLTVVTGSEGVGGVGGVGGEAVGAATDGRGVFELDAALLGALVRLECAGYAPAHFRVEEAMSVRLLAAVGGDARFREAEGVTLRDPATGATLVVAADSLEREDGTPHDGEARASLSVLSAAEPAALEAMPGDFSAVDLHGGAVQLESFGAVWVGLTDTSGRELRVRSDRPAMQVSMPSSLGLNYDKLGVAPALWSFDVARGKWIERHDADASLTIDGVRLPRESRRAALLASGVPVKSGAAADETRRASERSGARAKKGKRMQSAAAARQWSAEEFVRMVERWSTPGQPKTFGLELRTAGWWNLDAPYTAAMLSVRLTADGGPLRGASVWASGRDYRGRSASVSDADGCATLVVQFDSLVTLQVVLVAGGDERARLEAGAEAVDYVTLGEFRSGAAGSVLQLDAHDVAAAAA